MQTTQPIKLRQKVCKTRRRISFTNKCTAELVDAERKLKFLTEGKKTVKAQLVELNEAEAGESRNNSNNNNNDETNNGETATENGVKEERVSSSGTGSGVLVKVRGLFDYEATCDTELSFKEGGIFTSTLFVSALLLFRLRFVPCLSIFV